MISILRFSNIYNLVYEIASWKTARMATTVFRAYDYEDLKVISYVYKDEITFFKVYALLRRNRFLKKLIKKMDLKTYNGARTLSITYQRLPGSKALSKH